MISRTVVHHLEVASNLYRFIEDEALPETGLSSATFWRGFDAIVSEFAARNNELLAERNRLQVEMDAWHKAHPGPIKNMKAYRAFLEKIGYLVKSPGQVKCTTANVDAELAVQAANDINSTVDRQAIQTEVNALAVSNRDIVAGARYNNAALLDGTFSTQLQIGSEADQTMLVDSNSHEVIE